MSPRDRAAWPQAAGLGLGVRRSLLLIGSVRSSRPCSLFSLSRFFVRSRDVSSPRPSADAHLRGGGVKAGRRKRPPEGLGLDGAEHGAKIIVMERPSREEVWAAPSLRSGHALSRDKLVARSSPAWPGAAGLVPPDRDRCRQKTKSLIAPRRSSGPASRHPCTVLGRSRRGLEAQELVSRQARRPALSRPCAPCCVTLYGRDGKMRSRPNKKMTVGTC